MPSPERAWLNMPAVYWKALWPADAQGQAQVSTTPVQLWVRWKEGRTEMMGPNDNTITVDATVRAMVDLVPDSIMWLGLLTSARCQAIIAGNPGPLDIGPAGLHQVKSFSWTPDVKGRIDQQGNYVASRVAGLVRFRGTLPTGAG